VFCSFNVAFKLTPDMFDCWLQLLEAVNRSVLWRATA
jgi:predicted O-linked N-acetylglucosamine transferase (SPINDLY family)